MSFATKRSPPPRSSFKHFRGPAAELPPEALRNVILTIFKPWPPDGPRRSQRAHFKHFLASATELPQEAPRKVNLTIFKPWPPDGPRHPQRAHFLHFRTLATELPQEAPCRALKYSVKTHEFCNQALKYSVNMYIFSLVSYTKL